MSCKGRVSHRSPERAAEVIRIWKKVGEYDVSPYCRECKGYHILSRGMKRENPSVSTESVDVKSRAAGSDD